MKMRKKFQRILSMVLVVVMLVGALPMQTYATEGTDSQTESVYSQEDYLPELPESSEAESSEPEESMSEPESNPALEESSSAAEESSPVAEESSPVAEESSSVAEESTPSEEESSPVAEESTLSEEESSPAAEESSPAAEESTLSEEESSPVAEESSPAAEESTLSEEESSSAAEESSSATEESSSAAAETSAAVEKVPMKGTGSGIAGKGSLSDELSAALDMFRDLPSPDDITMEMTEEEKDEIFMQLDDAMMAYDMLSEEDMEVFNEEYSELLLKAMALNDALTGNIAVVFQTTTVPYQENSWNNTIITVWDPENDMAITDAVVTVTRKSGGDNYIYDVVAANGSYAFTRNSTNRNVKYTITVSKEGYESKTTTITGNAGSAYVNLTPLPTTPNWQTFRVFYIATGQIPSSYAGAGEASDYGPSSNNTPLVEIDVDINKLKREYSSVALYQSSADGTATGNNQWQFIPVGPAQNEAAAQAFWDAVWACASEESKEAFEATGFMNDFYGYVLKKQRDGSQHCDGVLSKEPPVYVMELYDNSSYFGGFATDGSSEFKTWEDVLDSYDRHLGVAVEWNSSANADGSRTGTYLSGDYRYMVNVSQSNKNDASAIAGSEIPYQSKNSTNTYYLATFNMTSQRVAVAHTVTYNDGVSDVDLFADDVHVSVPTGTQVPAFRGAEPTQAGHIFKGWRLDGDEGDSVYSAEEISQMTVIKDMTFRAVWEIVTIYTGTVKVILDGTYDESTDIVTSGQLKDIKEILQSDNAKLYVSTDESEYFELIGDHGVYSAQLEPGDYSIYCSSDGGITKTKITTRVLTIFDRDRIKPLFCYSVNYDLNGGIDPTDFPVEYYIEGKSSVYTKAQIPTREGHAFAGWKDLSDSTVYQKEQRLTNFIARRYDLKAQWTEVMDIYVDVRIQHVSESHVTDVGTGHHNVTFTLDQRAAGSTGDYTELASYSLESDCNIDQFAHTDYEAELITQENSLITVYTAKNPTFTNYEKNKEYTVTSHKPSYEIVEIHQEETAEGDLNITLMLQFVPETSEFVYEVELDEEAKALPSSKWPKAANVKVITWTVPEGGAADWKPIAQHKYTYERVAINSDGKGSGNYTVARMMSDSQPYYYRVEVVSFELPDGSVMAANNLAGEHIVYQTGDKRYEAKIETEGAAAAPSAGQLNGAWFEKISGDQQGTVKAVISMKAYTVTFQPNGGTLLGTTGTTTVPNRIVVPDLEEYVPTREEGYIFAGWYLADADGQITAETIASGQVLHQDITLIAKWNPPLTIQGQVAVASSYQQIDPETNMPSIHYLHLKDRAEQSEVLLRRWNEATKYWDTIRAAKVNIHYDGDQVLYGTGNYSFSMIPDDGSTYRIEVWQRNFEVSYQNEPDSLDEDYKIDPARYNSTDYIAEFDYGMEDVAVVNAFLNFAPESFDLLYEVVSDGFGTGYVPDSAEVLVLYNHTTGTEPTGWPAISQMIYGTEYGGEVLELTAGDGAGSYPVWTTYINGAQPTAFLYAIRVPEVKIGNTWYTYSEQASPFNITYKNPAHYDAHKADHQSQILEAKLTPKAYPIEYVLGIDSTAITGMTGAPDTHIWSHETDLSGVRPVRAGYRFLGWYDNAEFAGSPVAKIDASVAAKTTLFAKWQSEQDRIDLHATIMNTAGSNVMAANYDKDLQVQLTAALKNTSDTHDDVTGKAKSYSGTLWHNDANPDEDHFEVIPIFSQLSSAYDYSLNVKLDGYYVSEKTVEKTVDPVTGITHYEVHVTLQFNPDLLQLAFDVEMARDTGGNILAVPSLWPVSAEVKVTCWYDPPKTGDLAWNVIQQHETNTITVPLNRITGKGSGTYPVWQWHAEEDPYYYRIQVVSLKMQDGSVLMLEESSAAPDVIYEAGNYTATIETDADCSWNQASDAETGAPTTALKGAYGITNNSLENRNVNVYLQKGKIKAVIDVDAYTVTVDPNGGSFSDNTTADKVLENQLRMPSVSSYVPEKSGYTFDGWKYTKTVGGEVLSAIAAGELLSADVTLTAQWKKDVSQTKNLYYTVVHKINGVEQTGDTREYELKNVWIHDPNEMDVVSGSLTPKTKDDPGYRGYKFDSITYSIEPVNKTYDTHWNADFATRVVSETVVTLNYVKDDSQTKNVTYKVTHQYQGDASLTETAAYTDPIWINEADKILVKTGTLQQIIKTGYKFDSVNHSAVEGDYVPSGTEIVITYIPDTGQVKTVYYFVEHLVDGVVEKSVRYDKTDLHVLQPDEIRIKAGSLDPLAQSERVGYKFSGQMKKNGVEAAVATGDVVTSGTVITLIYEKDTNQTKPVSYTVHHKVGEVSRDWHTYRSTAWVNDDPAYITIEANSLKPKEYRGYKFSHTNIAAAEGTQVPDGTSIELIYVRDDSQNEIINYTVKHLLDGVEQTEDTKVYQKTIWINEQKKLPVVAGSLETKTYNGYKFVSATDSHGNPVDINAVTELPNESVISFHYTRDTFAYRIEYYYDDDWDNSYEGDLDAAKTELGTAVFGTMVRTYPDKSGERVPVVDGGEVDGVYILDKVDGLPLMIGSDPDFNVIKVYYAPDGDGVFYPKDGIPDKYQAVVTYKVEGGTWDGRSSADRKEVFTLADWVPADSRRTFAITRTAADGHWEKIVPVPVLGTTIPDVSGAKPNDDHKLPAWWSPIPYPSEHPRDKAVYTYRFTPKGELLTFTFDANGGAWNEAVSGYTMDGLTKASIGCYFGDEVAKIPVEPVKEGYEFQGWYQKNSQGDLTGKCWAFDMTKEYAYQAETIVYAKWKEIPLPPAPTPKTALLMVNCQTENGISLSYSEETVTDTYTVSPASTISYNGQDYTYVGIHADSPVKQLSGNVENPVILILLTYKLKEDGGGEPGGKEPGTPKPVRPSPGKPSPGGPGTVVITGKTPGEELEPDGDNFKLAVLPMTDDRTSGGAWLLLMLCSTIGLLALRRRRKGQTF